MPISTSPLTDWRSLHGEHFRGVRASLITGVTYHRLLLDATEAFLAEQPAAEAAQAASAGS